MKSRHYESDNLTFANISRRSVMKMIAFGLSFSVIAPTLANTSAYTAETAGKKPLIVYFSMPETDNPQNMTREEENSTVVIDGKVLGNTQYVAQLIQELSLIHISYGTSLYGYTPRNSRCGKPFLPSIHCIRELVRGGLGK